ncbi:hypothetical protein PABG_11334 [Paracoccidioides brasiliensis Pb03]|nr:hypothetical protein PABG_11334 [Paracoccidioides brasiliensis Pb03]
MHMIGVFTVDLPGQSVTNGNEAPVATLSRQDMRLQHQTPQRRSSEEQGPKRGTRPEQPARRKRASQRALEEVL